METRSGSCKSATGATNNNNNKASGIKTISVNLFRDEIEKFYVKNCRVPGYYVISSFAPGVAVVDGGGTTSIHTSSGLFAQTENTRGKCSFNVNELL